MSSAVMHGHSRPRRQRQENPSQDQPQPPSQHHTPHGEQAQQRHRALSETEHLRLGPQAERPAEQPSLDMASACFRRPIQVEDRQQGEAPFPATARPHTSSRTVSDATLNTTGRSTPGPSSPFPPSASPATTSLSNSRRPSLLDQSCSALSEHLPPLRPPNPAKKVTGRDELHSIITRQAIAEEQQRAAKLFIQQQRQRSLSLADLGVVNAPSTGASDALPLSSSPSAIAASPSPTRAAARPHITMAHRTTSIDSTASSLTSNTAAPPRPAGPQDVATLIAAAGGSAEVALQKLFAEKQQAASHNAQLWRLVEKQRAMILSLNKDLEKTHKEKEKYRKKFKDHLAQTDSMSVLTVPGAPLEEARGDSQSPASLDRPHQLAAITASLRDVSRDTGKASDASDVPSLGPSRSDTPQDVPVRAAHKSVKSGPASHAEFGRTNSAAGPPAAAHAKAAMSTSQKPSSTASPASPGNIDTVETSASRAVHKPSLSTSSIPSSPLNTNSPPGPAQMSSPKTRKAPPAPLKLKQELDIPVSRHIVDASDSEYEDDPESARSEFMERGRRKTREEDDRQREALAVQEHEHRSRSKKDKSSKSKPPTEPAAVPALQQPSISREAAPIHVPGHNQARPIVPQPPGTPSDILRARAVSDVASRMTRNNTMPSLLSPGLPMSPRPSDRPLNSPMPRAPMNSIPMSPRAGLPLSPRAPRQPIPLPPQTPLSMISPHLDRAKAYQNLPQMSTQPPPSMSTTDRPKVSPEAKAEHQRMGSSGGEQTPGEIYRGLVTEQYPDLLLPPNALPSIYVKTASSRMRPSRASFIAPKPGEENPVFTLAVHERSEDRQLWRLEKTFNALAGLDQHVRVACTIRDRLPDKALFAGHAPAKIDARRIALNSYFQNMLDSIIDEDAAEIVCRFLSTDALGVESQDYFGSTSSSRPDTPINKLRPNRAGYLTKRGKNFGGWKARYFVLDGPQLKYFEGPGGAQLGVIKLQNAQIGKQSNTHHHSQEDEDNQFRHAFLILEPKKKDSSSLVRHVLCAESDEERDAWVEVLLQYVDYKDDEEPQAARQAQVAKADIGVQRSPRLQKSMNDLRPAAGQKSATQTRSVEAFQALSYNDTVAGEAPTIGAPSSPPLNQTPSPHSDKAQGDDTPTASHPTISGPTNLHVIHNTGEWGMKPPATPNTAKDRKRSVFQLIHRQGRPSTESVPEKPFSPPAFNVRAVFGVPLAEAVEIARPTDMETELPVVVYRCIEYLMARNAIAEEGIFRLSGSNTVIRALKERFNTEGDVNLLGDGTYYDVHAVASLLKLYLRELPASILTRDLHLEFLDCLNLAAEKKVTALNLLVHRLPLPNRALLDALSAFLLAIVNNVEVNKMNVRNLGVVFSPTLNLPGPLISLFVEEQDRIFGPPMETSEAIYSARHAQAHAPSMTDLRSPRKQMFSDLPTPAYNQTHFQHTGGFQSDETGMIPMHPTYTSYQMAPQGEGGFGSLDDAVRSNVLYKTAGHGHLAPRDVKSQRRESGMMLFNQAGGPTQKPSLSRLREEEGAEF